MTRTFPLVLLLTVCLTWSCKTDDSDDPSAGVPNPGKNVAGYVVGTYTVSNVLSREANSSASLIAGAMTGAGTLTITRINDSTATFRHETVLTVTATGKKITMRDDVSNAIVDYTSLYDGSIGVGQRLLYSSNVVGLGRLISAKRLIVDRSKQDGYDITVEYTR
jgi:hypothetical protein